MRYALLPLALLLSFSLSACKDDPKDDKPDTPPDNEIIDPNADCDTFDDGAMRLACENNTWEPCEGLEDDTLQRCILRETKKWRYCDTFEGAIFEECADARQERWLDCDALTDEEEKEVCERRDEHIGECNHLFGLPTENSGLGNSECQPIIDIPGQEWEEPLYDTEFVDLLDTKELLTDLRETIGDFRDDDPYEHADDYLGKHDEHTVCAIRADDDNPDGYHLKTYESLEDAVNDGAELTHYGPCGLCSTMQDLAVYIREPDLTAPVRACGVQGLGKSEEEAKALSRECLQEVGFSDPCIDIWYWDIENTKNNCMATCLKDGNLTNPHHNPDLSLNACVQCDEDESGPLFKVLSGRTRRNSGLSSALCRPCETVQPVDHHYEWLNLD